MTALANAITTTSEAEALLDAYHNGRPEEPGVYETPHAEGGRGAVYVVKWNRAKTHLYAKRWEGGTLAYEPFGMNRIHPSDKIGYGRALAISALLGACCVCGRTLTDPKSVERGIGPVCRKLVPDHPHCHAHAA